MAGSFVDLCLLRDKSLEEQDLSGAIAVEFDEGRRHDEDNRVEGHRLGVSRLKKPIRIPSARSEQRFPALACTVKSGPADQFRSRAVAPEAASDEFN